MKKAIVLLLALALIGGAVFAQAANPGYTISGFAKLTWGYNLATYMSGFNNSYEFDLKFPFVTGTKAGASGEGVYGDISISGFDIGLSADETSTMPEFDEFDISVAAKLYVNSLYFGVYNKPSFTFTNAQYIEPYSKDGYDDLSSSSKSTLRPNIDTKGGTYIGYMLGALGTAELRIASIGDWKGTTVDDDEYAYGFNTTLTPVTMLKVNLGAMYRPDTKYLGLTGKLTVTPMDVLTIVAALDADKLDTASLKFDAFGSVGYNFNNAKDTVSVETYFADKNATGAQDRLDMAVKFADAEGFVPGLTFSFGVFANDLLKDPANDPLKLAIAEKLGYKVMLEGKNYLKPYQEFATNLNSKLFYLRVGLDVSVVKNTLFNVDYKVGSIKNDEVGDGFVTGVASDKLGTGVLQFSTKISF